MKCLTVSQPWAGLLILGIKLNETRSWNTKHRGQLAIHSSAKMSAKGKQTLDWLIQHLPDQFFTGSEAMITCTKLGMVLGTVNLAETTSTNTLHQKSISQVVPSLERILGDYSENRYFWKCENPVGFKSPVPAIGKLSLWNWDLPTV